MTPDLLVDNDVLIKLAAYGLLNQLSSFGSVGILGSARYVVSARLKKVCPAGLDDFASFLETVIEVEPTDAEIAITAALSEFGQMHGLPLDVGESQLVAITIERGTGVVITGDKRAIVSMPKAIASQYDAQPLNGRIVCLEQLILGMGGQKIRAHICSQPGMDKALRLCFGCYRADFNLDDVEVGLHSYVTAIRNECGELLYSADAFSPV